MADGLYVEFMGETGMWGVGEVYDLSTLPACGTSLVNAERVAAILYESMFCRLTAEAISWMYNTQQPPKDWEETKERLDMMGLPY
jgi:hypothetical protein